MAAILDNANSGYDLRLDDDGSGNEETRKFDELKRVILECIKVILHKLGCLKLEIQSIINSDQMNEKKAICNSIIEISKVLADFPAGTGYEATSFPSGCEYQPKLIAFHSNMSLLVWENCSKISIIEDYVINAANVDKVLIVGVTVRTVQKILNKLPGESYENHLEDVDNNNNKRTSNNADDDTHALVPDIRTTASVPDIVVSEKHNGHGADQTVPSSLLLSTPTRDTKRDSGDFSTPTSLKKKLPMHGLVQAELSMSSSRKSVDLSSPRKSVESPGNNTPKRGDSPSVRVKQSPSLMLRSDIMTIRGTKVQMQQEMAEVDSTVSKRVSTINQTQQELVSELMAEQQELGELSTLKLHGRLTALRRKGRRDSDTAAVARKLAVDQSDSNNTTPIKLSSSTGAIEPGGHLLALFAPLKDGATGGSNANTPSAVESEHKRKPSMLSPYKHVKALSLDGDADNPLVARVTGYQQDYGHLFISQPPPAKQMTIIDTELDIPHYTRDFFPNEHYNYLGFEKVSGSGPPQQYVVVSVLQRKCPSQGSSKSHFFEILVLIKTVEKDEPVSFTISTKSESISSKKALKMIKKRIPKIASYSLEEVTDQTFKNNLKDFECRQLRGQYRMGVLYVKNGQTSEDDMYSNVDPSPYFTEFLEVLGDTIELEGWTKFKGGLDVKSGTTGKNAVYTQFHSYDIMFHVSTMLPFQPNDTQRVERKRHLGNDVVLVVFVENDGENPTMKFDPSVIKSQFNHVFVLVEVDHHHIPAPGAEKITHYKMALTYKDGVPAFGPPFPRNYSFPKDKFRDIFVTKLINGERAALHAPIFAQKIKRTRKEALKMMYDTYLA